MSSADRLLALLGVFSLERPKWTVEEMAVELDTTVSTTYRYVRSLIKAGLVANAPPHHYTLGPAIIDHDRLMRLRDPLIASARPVMRRIARRVDPQALVLLCRLYQRRVICVHQESVSPDGFFERFDRGQTMNYERGQPMALHSGAPSKAILAHMKGRHLQTIYRDDSAAWEAAGLGRNWTEVKRALRELRNQNVVTTRGDLGGGMQGIAVPIHAAELGVIGSLSIVVPPDRPISPMAEIGMILTGAAREIEASFALEPTRY